MSTPDLEKVCDALQSNERHTKIAALEQLMQLDETSTDVLGLFDVCYLHLLKCYEDRYEQVRDLAVRTVTQFLAWLPAAHEHHRLNVLATLVQRLSPAELAEESEELRLICVQQLHALLCPQHAAVALVEFAAPDVVRILTRTLRDPYPAVQREACICAKALACAAGDVDFQAYAESLATAVYGLLGHKHAQTRIHAVQTLAQLALHVNPSGEALPRLFMAVSPLLMDTMPPVRAECGALGVLMLLKLRDRYSYFERIIPLVLCCLKDDSPTVLARIQPLWLQCGQQYYDENETELNRQALADVPSACYPQHETRPSIGCRGLVQRSLRLLPLIGREMADWHLDVRLHALRLLYQFALHAEAALTAKFFELQPDLVRACRDDEPSVVAEACRVADLLGRLLPYDDWWEHAFTAMERHFHLGQLRCFYHMFDACDAANGAHLLRLSALLATPAYSQMLAEPFQRGVLQLITTTLNKAARIDDIATEDSAHLERDVYMATVKVLALSPEDYDGLGGHILAVLTHRRGDGALAELHERHFARALADVVDLDGPVDEECEPVELLHGLLVLCQFRAAYLPVLQARIDELWQNNAADGAKAKIFGAISLAMLNWRETIGCGSEHSAQLLSDFMSVIVEPHLLWQAGATAEALRSLATATLCAAAQGAPSEAQLVLPRYAKYLPSLLADQLTATRLYALKCVPHLGPLSMDELKPLAYATLQRLDDPAAGLRVLVGPAVTQLRPNFADDTTAEENYELSIWQTFIGKALDLCLLHYDGRPELSLQASLKAAILQLAERYPRIAQDSYKRMVAAVACNSADLLALQKELPFTL